MPTSISSVVVEEGRLLGIQKGMLISLVPTDVVEETIYLYSNRLTLGLSIYVSYSG
jgi:hypothetical protein